MSLKRLLSWKRISIILSGALLGYAYYYFIGCNNGSCPITGNPVISTLYGALLGVVLILPSKKAGAKKDEAEN